MRARSEDASTWAVAKGIAAMAFRFGLGGAGWQQHQQQETTTNQQKQHNATNNNHNDNDNGNDNNNNNTGNITNDNAYYLCRFQKRFFLFSEPGDAPGAENKNAAFLVYRLPR